VVGRVATYACAAITDAMLRVELPKPAMGVVLSTERARPAT